MRVKTRCAGVCAQYVGWAGTELGLGGGTTVSDLRGLLAAQAGGHGEMVVGADTGFPSQNGLTVGNGAAAPGRTVLQVGDVVTLMPPAGGGRG